MKKFIFAVFEFLILFLFFTNVSGEVAGRKTEYSIVSVGTVRGKGKVITLTGIKQETWARFAMWMNDNKQIYFKSGEKFYGPVHSNTKMWFSGDPEFFEDVTSASTTFGGSTNNVIFHKRFKLGQPTQTMASINFTSLLYKATVVVTGRTDILFAGTNIVLTNTRMGWNNFTNPITGDVVIYVVTASSGSDRYGDAYVSGNLNGRVTIVTDRDINITDNITYFDDPRTNSLSDDACGLIARRDVVVRQSCPVNTKIFAHIIAAGTLTQDPNDGSFYVENYSSCPIKGALTVYGGIVQDVRGAVGTFSPSTGEMKSGYYKDYTYDNRFTTNPPPEYPPWGVSLKFSKWRDQ